MKLNNTFFSVILASLIGVVYADTTYQIVAYCRDSESFGFDSDSAWENDDVAITSQDKKTVYCNSYDIVGGGGEFVVPCGNADNQYYQFTYNSCKNLNSPNQIMVWATGAGGMSCGVKQLKVSINGVENECNGNGKTGTDIIPIGTSVLGGLTCQFTGPDDLFSGSKS